MKILISAFIVIVSLFFVNGNVKAQDQVIFPSAGLTPENPFYFLDRFGETLREFFTFSPEGKARLQITFAAERIAEIKAIFETKGIEAKGIGVAESRLQAHVANAATIVADQKSKGKDVSALAKELNDDFEGPKSALKQTFKEQKRAFEAQEKELKAKIKEARIAGNVVLIESLAQELGQVKAQKELIGLKEEEQKEALGKEEERIEEEMGAKEKAEKAIREVEKEKQDLLDEAAGKDIAVPVEAFGKFDDLLSQAKSALVAGNFAEAKRFAKQAGKSLDVIDQVIEDLKEAKEKEEELKDEQEAKEQEVKGEQEEKMKNEVEKEAERLGQEKEKAAMEARKAEEKLRKVGNEDENGD